MPHTKSKTTPIGKNTNPKPEKDEQKLLADIEDLGSEKTSVQTSVHSDPKLGTKIKIKFERLLKKINEFGEKHGLPIEQINTMHKTAFEKVANSRKNSNISQSQAITMLMNELSQLGKSSSSQPPQQEKQSDSLAPSVPKD